MHINVTNTATVLIPLFVGETKNINTIANMNETGRIKVFAE